MGYRELVFYDTAGTAYEPVRHINRVSGRSAYRVKPRGASNRTEDFLELDTIEEVARAMLVDGLPARVKAANEGGPVSVLRFGADLLASYELDPAIAHRLNIPARSGGVGLTTSPALDRLRERFLATFPDFEAVGGFAATAGTYHEAFRKQVDVLLAAAADHPTDGWAVLQDVLAASHAWRGTLPPPFGGHMRRRVPRTRDINPARFDAALDALVRDGGDPSRAVTAFNETFGPALGAIGELKAFVDTRGVPSTVLAAVAPNAAVSVSYSPYGKAERAVNGRMLFANKPLSADEYRAVLVLAHQIRAAMAGWGWHPRDLWDVHGFILATCPDRSIDGEGNAPTIATDQETRMADPTTLILYGPPGTGKTYATAAQAVRLCGEEVPESRDELMARYGQLVGAGQIEFVTFHQSMAYEEFVEGVRPVTDSPAPDQGGDSSVPSSGGFRLSPRDGIFKQISERARLSSVDTPRHLDRKRNVFKIALGRRGDQEERINEALERDLIHLGWGGDIDWSDEPFDAFEPIKRRWQEEVDPKATGKDPNIEMTYTFRGAMQPGDYAILSHGRDLVRGVAEITGEYFFDSAASYHPHRRTVRWLWKNADGVLRERFYPRQFRRHSCYQLAGEAIDWDALDAIVFGEEPAHAGGVPHVLVIDEINRANVSKVFGELITLLEADKRLGAKNELKVRLPYSGDSFGVPANLHIVGTMNTADRSIALLDTALRRRFSFEELMPRPDLLGTVGAIDLQALLTTLNDRIEYLFDGEHGIGHAYFMRCAGRADVDDVMRHKVIPLLAEYFYEDWTKVAAVLGDVFPDDGKPYDGNFLDRRALPSPYGKGDGEEASFRYRWTVRGFGNFSYDGIVQAAR